MSALSWDDDPVWKCECGHAYSLHFYAIKEQRWLCRASGECGCAEYMNRMMRLERDASTAAK